MYQTLAVSHDWGLTWSHALPPPHNLVAAVPYVYNQSWAAYGWAAPALIRSPADDFFYVLMWNKHTVGLQPKGITVMRTRDLTNPRSWRAIDSKGKFTVSFESPYTMTPGTESQHIAAIISTLPDDGCAPYGLVYSRPLRKFVVTLGCYSFYGDQNSTADDDGVRAGIWGSDSNVSSSSKQEENGFSTDTAPGGKPRHHTNRSSTGTFSSNNKLNNKKLGRRRHRYHHRHGPYGWGPGKTEFMVATSEDLITWSNATVLYSPKDLPANVSRLVTGMQYPSLMDPSAPFLYGDRNYATIGREAYLYWVSIGHSPYTDGRNLWATKMSFSSA